ncbi:MAG: hypothetical protein R2771_13935 [Saprospiraceae bacterium]
MKNLLFIIAVVVFAASCAKTPIFNSDYQKNQIQIDGNSNDWTGKTYFDSKSQVAYGVSNDRQNLYLLFKVSDESIQKKIMMAGLTVWIDTTGKTKSDIGVNYPVAEMGDMKHRDREMEFGQKPLQRKPFVKDSEGKAKMVLYGFPYIDDETTVNNLNNEGINAMVSIDQNKELVYELKIPLNTIISNPNKYMEGGKKYLTVGFETGEMSMPSEKGDMPEGGQRPEGAPSGSPGGGGRGSFGGGR